MAPDIDLAELARMLAEIAVDMAEPDTARRLMAVVEALLMAAGLPALESPAAAA